MTKPNLELYLAAPRGFCAGVDRAIKIVEMAIEKWGAPIFVRHEIVHNKYVVDELRSKGAIFVETLEECPSDRPVIFSAHGVPKSIPAEASARKMVFVDATCPLVSKVHIEAERHYSNGLQMVMIGHEGHPETIGTMGQLPKGEVLLVETPEDVTKITPRNIEKLAYITQTTLSVDDTIEIVKKLKARFPSIVGPHKEDICYATTNRQEAVINVSSMVDVVLVVGSDTSSNTKALVSTIRNLGKESFRVNTTEEIDNLDLKDKNVAVTAGASAPDHIVQEIINKLKPNETIYFENTDETEYFPLPKELRSNITTVSNFYWNYFQKIKWSL